MKVAVAEVAVAVAVIVAAVLVVAIASAAAVALRLLSGNSKASALGPSQENKAGLLALGYAFLSPPQQFVLKRQTHTTPYQSNTYKNNVKIHKKIICQAQKPDKPMKTNTDTTLQ